MEKKIKFYDTSSLLLKADTLFEDQEKFAISSITLEELEHIKTAANKDADVKYAARKLTHILDTHMGEYDVEIFNQVMKRLEAEKDNVQDKENFTDFNKYGKKTHESLKTKLKELNRSRQEDLSVPQKTIVKQNNENQIVYKIQILTSDKKLSPNSKLFKGYKNVDYFVEKGIYKYTYGETTSFNSIRKLRRQVAKNFKDAFIVAFKDGEKVKY